MYTILKAIHVTSVSLSVGLFVIRLMWRHTNPSRLSARWVRVVPHAIDTVLISSAVALCFTLHRYPFVHTWLTAKVLALFAYIICGSFALKYAHSSRGRLVASLGALICVAYILAVAITQDPALAL